MSPAPIELVEYREESPAARRDVERAMRESAFYFHACHGRTANVRDLDEYFLKEVPGIPAEDQRSYGIYAGYEIVGLAQLLIGWKRPGQSMIGLLLVSERHQGRGHARSAHTQLEAIVRATSHGQSMRIGVVEQNAPAFGFWRHLGYRENGERFTIAEFTSDVIILEKDLAAGN